MIWDADAPPAPERKATTPAELRELAGDCRRSGDACLRFAARLDETAPRSDMAAHFRRKATERAELAERLETLADSREAVAARVRSVRALVGDFRAACVDHLRLAARLDELGQPADAAEHRDFADRYDARAGALERLAARLEAAHPDPEAGA